MTEEKPTTDENVEFRDKYYRALADLENLRKRTQREAELVRDQAEAGVALQFLEIVDDFKRMLDGIATTEGPDAKEQIASGVRLVFEKLIGTLRRLEIEGFHAQGQKFTAELMEAIAQVPSRSLPPGTVESEISQGFTRRGKLLRPARVAVAIAAPTEEGGSGDA